ncbi:hypothetical protein [Ornithinimicrobium pratense]|uniref:Uncharacterized protein n=1 Tax=Ornithinimicrobium pratense TaxID=2593973 RepID=A0A5J6V563_9MICO|nr:hypothetical protein [Ornithinimicrobium pratense]QFG68271.1 hypothetical protein FY030_05655 [Ornithinimicrobium pratense]
MKSSHWSLTVLRVAALLASLLAIYQMFTGFGWAGPAWHGRAGELAFVLALVAAVGAFVWSRRSGNKGLLMHAAGMAVIGLVQMALGYLSVTLVHQSIGVLYLVGIIALATLAFRKPGTELARQETSAVQR